MKKLDKKWWFPVLCDDAYFANLRKNYPEDARLSDEELHEKYNEGLRYQRLWDHIGDAYDQFEELADDWVSLRKDVVELIEKMRNQLEREPFEDGMTDQEFHDEVLIPALNRFSCRDVEAPDSEQTQRSSHCSTFAFTDEHVKYVQRYGGRCRDCADEDGVCPQSGLPCCESEKAIRHVLDAIEYGVSHQFIENPNT